MPRRTGVALRAAAWVCVSLPASLSAVAALELVLPGVACLVPAAVSFGRLVATDLLARAAAQTAGEYATGSDRVPRFGGGDAGRGGDIQ